jgi:hypothetical protein
MGVLRASTCPIGHPEKLEEQEADDRTEYAESNAMKHTQRVRNVVYRAGNAMVMLRRPLHIDRPPLDLHPPYHRTIHVPLLSPQDLDQRSNILLPKLRLLDPSLSPLSLPRL